MIRTQQKKIQEYERLNKSYKEKLIFMIKKNKELEKFYNDYNSYFKLDKNLILGPVF